MEATDPSLWSSEQVVFCSDPTTGLRAVIAIDDTTLGPALGGVRFKPYPSAAEAAAESQRLARGMTLKNAAAGLPYGGGKGVIVADCDPADRAALMRAFGSFVRRLEGVYLPGVDMGTTVADLAEMAKVAPNVACDRDDPSPWTALGVFAGIRAAVAATAAGVSLADTTVVVLGVGNVGGALARLLARAGASVAVADIDDARAKRVAAEIGAQPIAVADAVATRCEVLAPCAAAKVIDHAAVPRLRCRVIAGAANDTLADRACAEQLAARGIVYVPDFLVNAGGVIHIHALRAGWDDRRLEREVLAIGDRVTEVVTEAETTGTLPLAVAETIARRRLVQTAAIAA